MKIWKSENESDKNIYCYYDDLVRLSNYELFYSDDLKDLDNSGYQHFGIGVDGQNRFLAQADGIQFIHQHYPESRTEINEALRQIGLTFLVELVDSKTVKHYVVKPD